MPKSCFRCCPCGAVLVTCSQPIKKASSPKSQSAYEASSSNRLRFWSGRRRSGPCCTPTHLTVPLFLGAGVNDLAEPQKNIWSRGLLFSSRCFGVQVLDGITTSPLQRPNTMALPQFHGQVFPFIRSVKVRGLIVIHAVFDRALQNPLETRIRQLF